MKASSFLTKEQKELIISAIKEAESDTSGEIRVHIETHCHGDALDRAVWVFHKLGMDRTKQKNGVLFYLAVADRKFAVIGDSGINSKVPEGFWNQVKELLGKYFSAGLFAEGLAEGIKLAGRQLKAFFPYRKDDINELSDDISFGTLRDKEEK